MEQRKQETNNEDKRGKHLKTIKRLIRKAIVSVLTAAILAGGGLGLTVKNALAYNAGIEAFVNSLYSDCLGRTADPTGFNDWCNKLATGQITGKQAAYGFFYSPEFINTTMTAEQLIDTYYHVFLNRTADPAGKSYWLGKISHYDFVGDLGILFTGFADSVEFANKCASYGIIAGDHIAVSTSTAVTAGGGSGSSSSAPSGNDNSGRNGQPASSAAALDAYWTSQGYEIYNIDLGNGQTQKCYALFYDMTDHNNQVNAWRNQNGRASLGVITNPADPRYLYCRTRAVEVAYFFSHMTPYCYALDIHSEDPRFLDAYNGYLGENIAGGTSAVQSIDIFRNSDLHNATMMCASSGEFVTACCTVMFVNPDGVTVTGHSPCTWSTSRWTGGTDSAAVQLFYGVL